MVRPLVVAACIVAVPATVGAILAVPAAASPGNEQFSSNAPLENAPLQPGPNIPNIPDIPNVPGNVVPNVPGNVVPNIPGNVVPPTSRATSSRTSTSWTTSWTTSSRT